MNPHNGSKGLGPDFTKQGKVSIRFVLCESTKWGFYEAPGSGRVNVAWGKSYFFPELSVSEGLKKQMFIDIIASNRDVVTTTFLRIVGWRGGEGRQGQERTRGGGTGRGRQNEGEKGKQNIDWRKKRRVINETGWVVRKCIQEERQEVETGSGNRKWRQEVQPGSRDRSESLKGSQDARMWRQEVRAWREARMPGCGDRKWEPEGKLGSGESKGETWRIARNGDR